MQYYFCHNTGRAWRFPNSGWGATVICTGIDAVRGVMPRFIEQGEASAMAVRDARDRLVESPHADSIRNRL